MLQAILKGFSFFLPASAFFLQKRYKVAAFCFLCMFLSFSLPTWLRLWSHPIAVMVSILLALSVWIFFLIKYPATQKNTYSVIGYFFRFCACIVFYILFAVFAISQSKWIWGYQLFHVPTPSMTPTFIPGDYVLADTWSKIINKSDIVVFKRNFHGYMIFNVKRVSHIAGDIFHEKTLNENQIAVIGDNSDNSEDSRVFGAINKSDIVGKVVWVAFAYDNQLGFRSDRVGIAEDK